MLALLPLVPLLALNGLAFVLDLLAVTGDGVARSVLLFLGLFVALGWLLLLALWVASLSASLAIENRSFKPLLLTTPSLGFVLFVAVSTALD